MGPILVAVGLFAALAAHQQHAARPTANVHFNAPRVFVQPGSKPVVTHLTNAPQLLCTMPMLRPQADVDPKIVVEPSKDVDYKIRIVEPPPCVERPSR
jgi:hypothetical protein